MARHYAAILTISLTVILVAAPGVLAQACPGVECPYATPTPTATAVAPTATPTGTRTPEPTLDPAGFNPTSTPLSMPAAEDFPIPHYSQPTSIPTVHFPDWPQTIVDMPDINTPAPPDPLATPVPLSFTTSLSPSANFSATFGGFLPAAGSVMTYSPGISGLNGTIGDTLDQGAGMTSNIISYTGWLSGQVAALQATDTFTLSTAPDWYAPQLPRDIANVGWTFEQFNTDEGRRYSIQTWAAMFGSIVAMPIKLTLNIWELFRFLGPFGLFVIWLLTMAALVFNLNVLAFLIKSAKTMYEFVLSTVAVLSNLLQWLWHAFLWVMDWTWIIVNWILDWIYKILNLIGNYLPFT